MTDVVGVGGALLLGLVQGLTEFLPISSSAHIRIVSELLTGADAGAAFTAVIQLGTETAVLLYFRRDLARILGHWWRALRGALGTDWRSRMGMPAGRDWDHDALMAWFIALGSIPVVVFGVLFKESIETTLRNLWITAFVLAAFALVLGYADRVGAHRRTLAELTPRHAVWFGLWQSLALIPGVSRSGGTITGGLFLGYTREAAARYSFLLAIPAVFGSGLFEFATSFDEFGTGNTPSLGVTFLATLVAFVVGYVVIIGFLRLISNHSYTFFVWYRIGLAVLVVLLLVTGALEANAPVPAG